MNWIEDLVVALLRFFRQPIRLAAWEPNQKSGFRAQIGFIERQGDKSSGLGREIVRARREMLFDRIMQTTHEMPVDQRPHFYSYKGGLEYRATALPADRSTLWAEGVKVDPNFEENRIRAGMHDAEKE